MMFNEAEYYQCQENPEWGLIYDTDPCTGFTIPYFHNETHCIELNRCICDSGMMHYRLYSNGLLADYSKSGVLGKPDIFSFNKSDDVISVKWSYSVRGKEPKTLNFKKVDNNMLEAFLETHPDLVYHGLPDNVYVVKAVAATSRTDISKILVVLTQLFHNASECVTPLFFEYDYKKQELTKYKVNESGWVISREYIQMELYAPGTYKVTEFFLNLSKTAAIYNSIFGNLNIYKLWDTKLLEIVASCIQERYPDIIIRLNQKGIQNPL